MNIGFLGGSFNPPHYGHLFAALYALTHFDLDQVWLAPVKGHPFGKTSIDFDHRLHMTRLLIQKFKSQLKVTDIENKLSKEGKTLHTLNHLKKTHPDHRLSLLVGSDLEPELSKWYEIQHIRSTYPIHIIPRGKNPDIPFYIPDISSTFIRNCVQKNKSLQKAMPTVILDYIDRYKLYASSNT